MLWRSMRMNKIGVNIRQKHRGFTIVELLIVIVVIGILAAITVVAYSGIQARAKDAQIKDAVSKVTKAVRMWSIDRGQLPTGSGWSSAATTGDGLCTSGGGGWIGSGVGYGCALENMLVDSKLLPTNFISLLPPNKSYGATDGKLTMMFYPCPSVDTNTFALYYYLVSPSSQDTTDINSTVTTCGQALARDTYGMRGAKLLTF